MCQPSGGDVRGCVRGRAGAPRGPDGRAAVRRSQQPAVASAVAVGFAGARRGAALPRYLVNFLYFTRFGSMLSGPRRRTLSAS